MGSDPVFPIGVFDSGVGGLSILRALRAELPDESFVYLADSGFAPYGERDDDYVAERSRLILRRLLDEHGIKALVVACNTATAAAIHLLRGDFPDLPLIGVEPALKPAAALSQTRRIGVLATRGTLASAKFQTLHQSLQHQVEFRIQACDGLADAIERADLDQVALLCQRYTQALGTFGPGAGEMDTLVLGCTHYVFAQAELERQVGLQVRLVETGTPVARHTRQLLAASGMLARAGPGELTLLATGALGPLKAAAARWL